MGDGGALTFESELPAELGGDANVKSCNYFVRGRVPIAFIPTPTCDVDQLLSGRSGDKEKCAIEGG